MAYLATVIEVMIASPGDVDTERGVIREVLTNWNALHSLSRSVVLLPIGWDTHSASDLGGRPQEIINQRILERSDLLVGIFGTRVGTPTGKAMSGTIEEIQRHHAAGKPVMLYFSDADLPRDHDRVQLEKLEEFKGWARQQGLVGRFRSADELRRKFENELQLNLQGNPFLADILSQASAVSSNRATPRTARISSDGMAMLRGAADDAYGQLLVRKHLSGTDFNAGSLKFDDNLTARDVARWQAAVDELEENGLIHDASGKRQVFLVTNPGYQLVENDVPADESEPAVTNAWAFGLSRISIRNAASAYANSRPEAFNTDSRSQAICNEILYDVKAGWMPPAEDLEPEEARVAFVPADKYPPRDDITVDTILRVDSLQRRYQFHAWAQNWIKQH